MISALTVFHSGDIKQQRQASCAPSLPLAVGEVVEATVTAKQDGKFLIAVKGIPLEASSALPLVEGQRITVRIGQLHPQIVMIPMNGEETDLAPRLAEFVRYFKQEPSILKGIFKMGQEILSPANIDQYQKLMPGTDLRAIRDRFSSLLFSRDTLQEYAGRLGLLHERAIARGMGAGDNLKAMLMRLEKDIDGVPPGNETSGKDLAGLRDFASTTIGKIETFQAVNLLSAQNDGLFFLPFPFLSRNEIRTGEFFASRKETSRGKELRAILFLDMDGLGKVMAEARLTGGSIRCFFRCENEDTRDLLAEKIPLLKEGFEALGYETGDIKCYHEKAMDAMRREILEEMPAYSADALNILI